MPSDRRQALIDSASPDEAIYLRDGRVSSAELAKALGATVTCMEAAGLAHVAYEIDPDGLGYSIQYEARDADTNDSAARIEDACTSRFLKTVYAVYMLDAVVLRSSEP